MTVSRRNFLLAGTSSVFLSSCATDLQQYSDISFSDLAAKLGVCDASYVTLQAGIPSATMHLSNCSSSPETHSGSIFQAASLTKQIIAFAALKLVREGRLDLKASVAEYLPNGYTHFQKPLSKFPENQRDLVPASVLQRIPIASLLNHSSGLPNWTSSALMPEFEPGMRWQYSGEGYVLLHAVVSAVTGMDLETIASTYVFKPLQMHDSRMRLTPEISDRTVRGNGHINTGRQLNFHTPNAAASLHTTATDYAKFLSAWLMDASLLSLAMGNPISVQAELGLAWGSGWGIEDAAGGPYIWQ